MEKIDPKYIGVPNICFSLSRKEDNREIYFKQQRMERGFDDTELWSLRDSIALFIIPRLERYEEIAKDFLVRDKSMVQDIDNLLIAFKLITRDDGSCFFTDEEEKKVVDGLKGFPKIFMSLWY